MKGLAAAIVLALFASPVLGETLDYSRDVLPILSANCFVCHGRDVSTRQAKMRLDLRAEATRIHDDVSPIIPGIPDQSMVIYRITSDDPEVRMPPPAKKNRLTDQQIATIRRWISEGAE